MSFPDLRTLCKGQEAVISALKKAGVNSLDDVACLCEEDIRDLKLTDLVVQRRLLNAVGAVDVYQRKHQLLATSSVDELCLSQLSAISALGVRGVISMRHVQELTPAVIMGMNLSDLVVRRRLLEYIDAVANPPKRLSPMPSSRRKVSPRISPGSGTSSKHAHSGRPASIHTDRATQDRPTRHRRSVSGDRERHRRKHLHRQWLGASTVQPASRTPSPKPSSGRSSRTSRTSRSYSSKTPSPVPSKSPSPSPQSASPSPSFAEIRSRTPPVAQRRVWGSWVRPTRRKRRGRRSRHRSGTRSRSHPKQWMSRSMVLPSILKSPPRSPQPRRKLDSSIFRVPVFPHDPAASRSFSRSGKGSLMTMAKARHAFVPGTDELEDQHPPSGSLSLLVRDTVAALKRRVDLVRSRLRAKKGSGAISDPEYEFSASDTEDGRHSTDSQPGLPKEGSESVSLKGPLDMAALSRSGWASLPAGGAAANKHAQFRPVSPANSKGSKARRRILANIVKNKGLRQQLSRSPNTSQLSPSPSSSPQPTQSTAQRPDDSQPGQPQTLPPEQLPGVSPRSVSARAVGVLQVPLVKRSVSADTHAKGDSPSLLDDMKDLTGPHAPPPDMHGRSLSNPAEAPPTQSPSMTFRSAFGSDPHTAGLPPVKEAPPPPAAKFSCDPDDYVAPVGRGARQKQQRNGRRKRTASPRTGHAKPTQSSAARARRDQRKQKGGAQ